MSLRELREAATPGPWEEYGRDVCHTINPERAGESLGCDIEGPPFPCLDRGRFGNHHDAALIVALVNACPEIEALIEAASRDHGRVMRTAQPEPSDQCCCGRVYARCSTAAALEALRTRGIA